MWGVTDDDMIREQSNFQVEPVEGGSGVYAGGMGEMQEDDACEGPRAVCDEMLQEYN
jgi:hypothetical protein